MRTMNENDFVNLLQFSLQELTFKNDTTTITVKNKIFYRDGKSLNDQYITIKNF